MEHKIKAWHFLPNNRQLANGDGRLVLTGKTYEALPVILCHSGLHWSKRLIDALQYAPGNILTYCEVWGTIKEQHDKGVSSHRRVIAMLDAEELLFEASRHFAAEVFWKHFKREDFPAVVKWLDEGNKKYRSAAYSAAYSAAHSAARSAADSAAYSAYLAHSAESAARSAARSAAYSARSAAYLAANASSADLAHKEKQNKYLEEKALQLMRIER